MPSRVRAREKRLLSGKHQHVKINCVKATVSVCVKVYLRNCFCVLKKIVHKIICMQKHCVELCVCVKTLVCKNISAERHLCGNAPASNFFFFAHPSLYKGIRVPMHPCEKASLR